MGGWGSGSYYRALQGKAAAESSLPLDIRKISREGCLTPGRCFSWQWSAGGNVHSSIGATTHEDYLFLHYTHKKTEEVKQRIDFDWTQCNYGGKRIWFLCPGCGKRMAILYGAGKYFLCRHCHNLTYQTCNETPRNRLFSKANKLRGKIGAKAGCLNPLPLLKPKGMHQVTWSKIRAEVQHIEMVGIVRIGRLIGA